MLYPDSFLLDDDKPPRWPHAHFNQLLPAIPQFTDLPTWEPIQRNRPLPAPRLAVSPTAPQIPQLLPGYLLGG